VGFEGGRPRKERKDFPDWTASWGMVDAVDDRGLMLEVGSGGLMLLIVDNGDVDG